MAVSASPPYSAMPRIAVELPARFPFSTEIAIYQSHINEAGHLDNAQLLTLVSEARMRFFTHLGFDQGNIEGVGIVIADAAVQYRSEAFRGEVLVLALAAHDFNERGCDLAWQAREKTTGREVARGKTGIVFFDYATRTVAAVPPSFRRRVDAAAAAHAAQ